MTFDEAVKTRVSVRAFKEDPVPKEMIEAILEAARIAPSGSNLQPIRYMVITNAQLREKCRPFITQKFVTDAPVLLLCLADRNLFDRLPAESRNTPYNQKRLAWDETALLSYLTFNAGLSLEHAVLKAADLSLGSCIIRMFDQKGLSQMLELPKNLELVALLPIGYPEKEIEPKHDRMSLSELIYFYD